MRLWRKSIKTAKEERFIDAVRDVGGSSLRELIRSIGTVGTGVAKAHGEMFRGWFTNQDPLTWAGDALAVSVYVVFVANLVKVLGEKVGLKDLDKELGMDLLAGLPMNVTSVASNLIPDAVALGNNIINDNSLTQAGDPAGLYCFRVNAKAPTIQNLLGQAGGGILSPAITDICVTTPGQRDMLIQQFKDKAGSYERLYVVTSYDKAPPAPPLPPGGFNIPVGGPSGSGPR